MNDKVLGIAGIAIGVLFLVLWAVSALWKAKQGRLTLDGRVTGVDPERQLIRVRYRTGRDTYHETEFSQAGAFLSGRIPPVGLRVSVTVYKADPYTPVSLLMIPSSGRITKKPYFNSGNTINRARILVFCLLFIAGGLIAGGTKLLISKDKKKKNDSTKK